MNTRASRVVFSFLLALVLSASRLHAVVPCRAPDTADRAARWTAHLEREAADGFSGIVLAADGDSIVYRGRFGAAAHDSAATAYWIGSITKTLTAVTVMRLVEEGKLALEAPIGTYLPDVPDQWRSVTIHHLLGHRAGFPDNYPADGIADRAEAIRRLLNQQPIKPLGEFRYSNDGYALLGILIEIGSGQSFEEAVRQRVLVPAGMTRTGFRGGQVDSIPVAPPADPKPPARIRPTIWTKNRSVANYGYKGSGGIWSTTDDLLRFASAFRHGRLVSPASVTLMTTSKKASPPLEGNSYGYGWALTMHEGRTVAFWHGGNEDWQGHNAMLKVVGESTWVILSNSGDVDGEGWSNRIEAGLRACEDR